MMWNEAYVPKTVVKIIHVYPCYLLWKYLVGLKRASQIEAWFYGATNRNIGNRTNIFKLLSLRARCDTALG